MTGTVRLSSQLGSYFVALTAADAVFSIMQFSLLMSRNIPEWGGFPTGIVASDIFMMAVVFILQWPVIVFLSAIPFLIALLIQRSTHIVSPVIFLLTGALIGGLCLAAMYFLYFSNASDGPDGPDPAFYVTHTGAIAIIAGIIGAYVFRRLTLSKSTAAS